MTMTSRFFGRALQLPPAQTRNVRVERDLEVPMPDGAVLLADRYAPPADKPALVLVRSPYGRRGPFGLMYGRLLAERGFQVLVQSCRGTFGSGGRLDPFAERDDGLATVAWMRRQPWYPGSFGTAGPSYLGLTQWAIVADAGPELKGIAAQITTSDPAATIYQGGAFALETMLRWVDHAAQQERRLTTLRQRRVAARLQPLLAHLPLADLDQLATGRRVSYWQDWLTHDQPADPYWDTRRFSDRLAAVSAPVSLVGGWFDPFLPAMLRDYAELRAAGRPHRAEPYLLIGPWQHLDQEAIAASVRDSLAWLRAHLLGDTSQLRPAPVRIFVGGVNGWRDLPGWPPPSQAQRWHLHAGHGLGPQPPAASEPDSYTYNPASPTPSLGGPGEPRNRQAQPDNQTLETRPDVLTYTSQPLDRDLEVIGQATAELFVGSSRAHTDFFARLCDVDQAGRSVNICDGLLRLSPGKPPPGPGGTTRAHIDLWSTAHCFRAGHRLRLQVSSGAHPRYSRNTGTGEPIASATTLAIAHQSVYHDPSHPSAIVLPVSNCQATSQ